MIDDADFLVRQSSHAQHELATSNNAINLKKIKKFIVRKMKFKSLYLASFCYDKIEDIFVDCLQTFQKLFWRVGKFLYIPGHCGLCTTSKSFLAKRDGFEYFG